MVRKALAQPWIVLLFVALTAPGCDEPSAPTATAEPSAAPPPSAATATSESVTASAAGQGGTAAARADGAASTAAAPTGSSASGVRDAGLDAAASAGVETTASPATTEMVRGAEKGTGAYRAWLQSPQSAKAGEAAFAQAVLVAKGEYKCNEKYPYKFKLDDPPAGVSYPQRTARGMQYDPRRSVLAVPFVATRPGTYTISGQFRFSVCTKERCIVQKQSLSAPVTVK